MKERKKVLINVKGTLQHSFNQRSRSCNGIIPYYTFVQENGKKKTHNVDSYNRINNPEIDLYSKDKR